MKKDLTEVVFILDRSGSMTGLESDTIGGFNSLIAKQKRESGEAYVTTVLFDDKIERIHDRIRLADVPKMTEREYYTRGCTALLDAVGSTIRHISQIHKYAREEDVPEHTVFVITTDGMENASRRYDSDEVKKMIEHEKEKYGWEFIFLGANIDAAETARRIGIDEEHAANYCHDELGTQLNYEAMSDAVSFVRCSIPTTGFKARVEADFKKRGKK